MNISLEVTGFQETATFEPRVFPSVTLELAVNPDHVPLEYQHRKHQEWVESLVSPYISKHVPNAIESEWLEVVVTEVDEEANWLDGMLFEIELEEYVG